MPSIFDAVTNWELPAKVIAAQTGIPIHKIYKERGRLGFSKAFLRRIPPDQQPQDYKLIRCKLGEIAKVDNEDFELVSKYCWYEKYGYATAFINKKQIRMHQLILGRGGYDHRFGDRMDNRRAMLRPATMTENNRNKRKCKNPKTSKYKGVYYEKHKEMAGKKSCWRVNVANKYVGYFRTEEEAARAYDRRAKEVFGEFAWLNFPEPDPKTVDSL